MADAEFAYRLCGQMLENALALLDAKSAMLGLCRFLQEFVPFEHVLCFKVDRAQRMAHIVLDYTPADYLQNPKQNKGISSKRVNILSWETIFHTTIAANKIVDDINAIEDVRLREYFKLLIPYHCRSFIYMTVDYDMDADFIYTIFFTHHEPGMFFEDHQESVGILHDAIQKTAMRLVEETGSDFLALGENGAIPASPDASLRRCPGLAGVMRRVDAVAPTSGTVLITGATGVGKELVAESIHALSPRWRGPFIKVNSGAIPDTLIDSALFGHEKGAFTGATTSRPGYFEQANGGTIYLDEIGELPLQAQVRLLRVLEAREIQRIGGTRRIPLDIRVIAATNRNLRAMVAQGTFREDLWYRLHVFSIPIPSLAARPEDIPILARQFLAQYAKEQGIADPPRLDEPCLQDMLRQPWRGNVRELRYAVERATLWAVAEGSRLLRLVPDDRMGGPLTEVDAALPAFAPARREEARAAEIRSALARSGGRIQGEAGAASLLGVSPSTLRSRMARLGIPLPRQRA